MLLIGCKKNLPKTEDIEEELERRPRSATLLNLQWLAERLRKARSLRRDVAEGNYTIDSKRLAKALLNQDEES